MTTPLRQHFTLPDEVTYLNHGSFGLTPRVVQEAREQWSRQLAAEPMDFFLRQLEPSLTAAAERLGAFLGADARDLAFVENATVGMNIVANSVRLQAGDEVLLTNHEYGAVMRIWRRACEQVGADLVVRPLPLPLTSAEEAAEHFLDAVTPRTKLIVVSHVTSPTAVVQPVKQICRRARELGVPVCIDGPHAIAMVPLNLRELPCDFYTASCHKWLSAPFGSGFLYVRRRQQSVLQPLVVSWGRSLGGRPPAWQDEYNWLGTRDPAACLAVPKAIEFLEDYGLTAFREQTHALAQYARRRMEELFGQRALVPDSPEWYGSMVAVPLPPSDIRRERPNLRDPLQEALWEQHRIETLIVEWHGQRLLRVSCHLYNTTDDIDRLIDALKGLKSKRVEELKSKRI